jgi:hypothetical protein
MSGDDVEALACALVLSGNPDGNRITPSRGDRGIDFRIFNGTGWDIYQVKRYSAKLTARQAGEIEKSWTAVASQVMPTLKVDTFTVVLPWDPSTERIEWLERLTEGSGVRARWIGRSHLDAMAADRPQLVDYFHGDGATRLHNLLRDAMSASLPIPTELADSGLLTAGIDRHASLARALDQIDPFYRYTFDVRPGQLLPGFEPELPDQSNGAVLILYRQLDGDRYVAVRITPRYDYSPVLRPITRSITFEISDPADRERLDNFRRYGAPF